MKLPLVIRSIGTTLALVACASMAFAGASFTLDDAPRAHTPAPRAGTPAHVAPADDPGCTPGARCVSATTTGTAASTAAPRAPQVPAGDHRADKGEHGRPASTTAMHSHRPVTQRSKGSLRNTPATPGMGLLLRMGTGAGRELSLLLDDVSGTPVSRCAGRAPPCARSTTVPARDPIACAAAPEPRTVTPRLHLPGVAPETHHSVLVRSACPPPEWAVARVSPLNACRAGLSSCFNLERVACSLAPGLEGARA